ncbi:MAG: hypothetical protein JNK29_16165, partial [Anaerolineales bacterium]|nr:hypothetical protein [Anaerolineales bacterium]
MPQPLLLRRLTLAAVAALLLAPAAARAQTFPDYNPPEILDKPLGVTRLPNGNTLIADTGGANYTSTDAAVLEVDPAGQVVWVYAEPMNFTHSANPCWDDTLLITDTGNDRVIRVDHSGRLVWSTDDWGGGSGLLSDGSHLDYPNDGECLDNGHLLLSDRNNDRVLETTADGQVVWTYAQLLRPHNPDRLPNGNTMISDSERNFVIEVDPQGQVVWEYGGSGLLNWPRDADRLANGNTLITDSRNNRILEVTPAGRLVWEYDGLSIPYEADRLANGNTLISDNNHKRVIEVTPDKRIVWSFRNFPDQYPDQLQNGGFEQDANGDGLPDGWYPADLNAEGPAAFLYDGAVKRSGARSAGLEYHGLGRIAWLQTVTVQPGATYYFSGDLKAEINSGVAAYQLWFVDDLGGPLGDPTTVASLSGSADWTTAQAALTAPQAARAVQVWCLSVADGKVWCDKVQWGPSALAPAATGPAWGWLGLGLVAAA